LDRDETDKWHLGTEGASMPNDKTLFIVGAGFSKNAGLPLQSEFTRLFLRATKHRSGLSRFLMPTLAKFVEGTFGFMPDKDDVSSYPDLEDIFTMLDLSANSGHNLGLKYPPQELRTVRRMLLSRIIRMLNKAYLDGKRNPPPERTLLLDFLRGIDPEKHQFVSLNWDLVIEGCLEELRVPYQPYYSREIDPIALDKQHHLVCSRPDSAGLTICKMHGSINWLYCDCCRRAYWVPVRDVARLAVQVLKKDEVEKIYPKRVSRRLCCPSCEMDLGVRLATFSYQKSLKVPLFESAWLEAEKVLRRAAKWVFIGYSLPAADFEFKYLLKRVALSRSIPPQIVVVTKNPPRTESQASTERQRTSSALTYQRFSERVNEFETGCVRV
jgi:NAD-dependent SIR2 family protein deacetylase